MDLIKALYNTFKSVKLAITLLLILTVLAIVATLVPQGLEAAAYQERFPGFWAWLITTTGFGQFSRSALFLIPAALFFLNTAACAVDRFMRRLRVSAPLRFGPDLVHIGILVLVVGGIVTATARQEGFAYMAPGDQVLLTDDVAMTLRTYRFDKYPDGRPRQWVSTVDVTRGGVPVVSEFAIEVNRPLSVGGLKVFQTSFATEARARVVDSAGHESLVKSGEALRQGQKFLILTGIEDSGRKAVFEQWEGHTPKGVTRASVSERVGDYTVREIKQLDVTGLKVVDDPGFAPVLAALLLIAGGLAVTCIQKLKDKQL
jgi:cytochrome c biogenesis protein ResB